jgi:hypothetical protein
VSERFPEPARGCGLGELAESVGRHREAARALGAQELDASLRPTAIRVSQLLLDPELRTVVYVLESFERPRT